MRHAAHIWNRPRGQFAKMSAWAHCVLPTLQVRVVLSQLETLNKSSVRVELVETSTEDGSQSKSLGFNPSTCSGRTD